MLAQPRPPGPAPTHHSPMHKHLALALAIALAQAPAHAQQAACFSTIEGWGCVGPNGTTQLQPTVVPGQWAVSGQTKDGGLYGCQATTTLSGDVVSTCR